MNIVTSALIVLLLPSQAESARLERDKLRENRFNSLALAYQANKEMFRHGKFRFAYTTGRSNSIEEALAGRFVHLRRPRLVCFCRR